MFDTPRDELYIQDLKTALEEYQEVNKELVRISQERHKRVRLVKSLLQILKIRFGETKTRDLLEKYGLADLVRPFYTLQTLHTAGAKTVVRRRRGETKAVDPAAILAKGTPVRMLSGRYEGYKGFIASSQARQSPKGLDVTYFLSLVGPKGDRVRTSVKHGTLNKTWGVTS